MRKIDVLEKETSSRLSCEFCPKQYQLQSYFEKHMREKHPKENPISKEVSAHAEMNAEFSLVDQMDLMLSTQQAFGCEPIANSEVVPVNPTRKSPRVSNRKISVSVSSGSELQMTSEETSSDKDDRVKNVSEMSNPSDSCKEPEPQSKTDPVPIELPNYAEPNGELTNEKEVIADKRPAQTEAAAADMVKTLEGLKCEMMLVLGEFRSVLESMQKTAQQSPPAARETQIKKATKSQSTEMSRKTFSDSACQSSPLRRRNWQTSTDGLQWGENKSCEAKVWVETAETMTDLKMAEIEEKKAALVEKSPVVLESITQQLLSDKAPSYMAESMGESLNDYVLNESFFIDSLQTSSVRQNKTCKLFSSLFCLFSPKDYLDFSTALQKARGFLSRRGSTIAFEFDLEP